MHTWFALNGSHDQGGITGYLNFTWKTVVKQLCVVCELERTCSGFLCFHLLLY